MPKRKSVSLATEPPASSDDASLLLKIEKAAQRPSKRKATSRQSDPAKASKGSTNPDKNANVLDSSEALRASPDATAKNEQLNLAATGAHPVNGIKNEEESVTASVKEAVAAHKAGEKDGKKKAANKSDSKPTSSPAIKSEKEANKSAFLDPEADEDEEADEAELQAALGRPPPVHSDYLPLPWKGRLGYACLNTYLRFSNPPVFSSRTCRIASILENRHPLTFPNEPPHATKNRPDRTKPADVARGQAFVESLGKQNAKDIVKMLRWNDRYGIKFMRLSSEMFPFASHADYGYKLAPFVSEELAEAGKVAAQLGHRLTTHPGQYTQLGSPRKEVIDNAIRDLDYHAELLSLLKMPPQQDRDAVMILHLGGVFGDKAATLDRFRENYAKLSQNVKNRLVLENDDVSWHVHDLLPICEELNIPMVLDFHHHNIIFDADKLREGTKDIVDVFPRILATWKRKNITPKMHYSEPTPAAITPRQRRKHNPRVATLPPCSPTMDLMIEAKDKEQAVFELMRTFKLPGYDTFSDIVPHVRKDDNKPVRTPKKKAPKKSKGKNATDEDNDSTMADEESAPETIPEDEVGMGGPEGRVYWPPGMEDWLRPVKRVVKPKNDDNSETGGEKKLTPAQKKKAKAAAAAEAAKEGAKVEEEVHATTPTPASKKAAKTAAAAKVNAEASTGSVNSKKPAATKVTKAKGKGNSKDKSPKHVPTPSTSDDDDDDDEDDAADETSLSDLEDDDMEKDEPPKQQRARVKANTTEAKVPGAGKEKGQRQSGRSKKRISYAEEDED